ncbi:14-3-3-like protein GF14 iota isoform X1 [Tanacetum coccineum]|uniref:14-3-3-like protein GF14 iota isoform X1 n=1 Tax=Tanacetum coccineum TaxID=301880 RepID=A0ABQ5GXQ7_9ASTR
MASTAQILLLEPYLSLHQSNPPKHSLSAKIQEILSSDSISTNSIVDVIRRSEIVFDDLPGTYSKSSVRWNLLLFLRASPCEFVIPLSKYVKVVYHIRVSVGIRFRMLFATEESSLRRKDEYYRYLAEFKSDAEREEATSQTLKAYEATTAIAETELPPTNPIRLGLALNLSVFYYEIISNTESFLVRLECCSFNHGEYIKEGLSENLVVVDIALSAHVNSRWWYEQKKKQESKQEKTITVHAKAFKAAQKKTRNNSLREDEMEHSTIVDIMFPAEPPVVCEFDCELDELEEFTNKRIASKDLTEDQKDEFKVKKLNK